MYLIEVPVEGGGRLLAQASDAETLPGGLELTFGLLFLASCVVLVGLLVAADSQDAARVAQFLGIALG